MEFEKTYHLHPAMKLLGRALQKERTTKLVAAILLMSGGITLPYIYFSSNNLVTVAGLAALLAGIRLMYEVIRTPRLEDNRLWMLLNRDRRKIVWVYSVHTQTMPYGFHLWDTGTMYFMLADGDQLTVDLPTRKIKMVSVFLNRLLPHASFGYSEARMRLFEQDPVLLLKENEGRE